MFKVQLSGYLGKDSEIKNHEGKVYFNFGVANNYQKKINEGWEKCTQWENCFIVIPEEKTKILDYFKDSLVKGAFVVLESKKYNLSIYQNAENEQKSSLKWFVLNSDITIVKTKETPLDVGKSPNLVQEEDIPDDLPF